MLAEGAMKSVRFSGDGAVLRKGGLQTTTLGLPVYGLGERVLDLDRRRRIERTPGTEQIIHRRETAHVHDQSPARIGPRRQGPRLRHRLVRRN